MSDMTSKRKEKISAFLDNDMHRDELMSFSLSSEADDAITAQHYHMIGDALRGEMSDSSFIDVSQAVREALADEEIIVNNHASQGSTPESSPASAANVARPAGIFDLLSRPLTNWFKPVAGMTVATFVAVVMVVSLSENNSTEPAPVASIVENAPVVQLAAEKKVDEKDPTVNKYLVDQHLEFATQDAFQGRLPYVRAVSFESKDKPSK